MSSEVCQLQFIFLSLIELGRFGFYFCCLQKLQPGSGGYKSHYCLAKVRLKRSHQHHRKTGTYSFSMFLQSNQSFFAPLYLQSPNPIKPCCCCSFCFQGSKDACNFTFFSSGVGTSTSKTRSKPKPWRVSGGVFRSKFFPTLLDLKI